MTPAVRRLLQAAEAALLPPACKDPGSARTRLVDAEALTALRDAAAAVRSEAGNLSRPRIGTPFPMTAGDRERYEADVQHAVALATAARDARIARLEEAILGLAEEGLIIGKSGCDCSECRAKARAHDVMLEPDNA